MSNQNQSKLVDVSSMNLKCKTCTKDITQLPFVPKTDGPINCIPCHAGRDKSGDRQAEKGGGRNDRNRGGDRVNYYTKGEQMEVKFGEKDFPSGRRVVSYVTDERGSVIVYVKSKRFRPIIGKAYQCSVMFKKNERGTFGLALPTSPFTLTPEEWLPVEELRSCLVQTLTFQQKQGPGNQGQRLISWHDGVAVFPDNGTTVVQGKPTVCLLREAGNVAFAIPLGIEQQTGKGLMTLGEKMGEVLAADLKHVVVKAASKKAGVIGMPKVDKDLEISGEYRSIYEVLSDPEAKLMVNESSTEDEVGKAYRRKAAILHPDKVAQDFGGMDKVPLPIKKNSEFFFEALGTAKERALDLIARKKANAGKREAPKGTEAAQVPNSGQATALKGDKPGKRERKNRGKGSEQPKAPVAAVAQPAETVPVEGAVETSVAAEESAKVEAPKAEAEPVAETAAAETQAVDASSKEDAEAVEIEAEAAKLAKVTVEDFRSKTDNIRRFHLRQAKVNIKNAKAKASASATAGSKKPVEAKGGNGGSKDFREQLAALSTEKK